MKRTKSNMLCGDPDGQCMICREVQSSSTKIPADGETDEHSGWTPFLRACRHGQTDIVAELISSGADPYESDSLGWNAVPLAAASGNLETLKVILKAEKWNRKDLAPAICIAALNGDCKVAEVLFLSRASPNTPIEGSGITPLMLAASEGQVEMVSLLLEHDADPDMTNALHQTALDAAVIRNQTTIQNILGPVTHLRSKISSHIPLPISPPNRALQSSRDQPDPRFHGISPMGYCQSHSSGYGSSPMLHCGQISSPMRSSFYLPSGGFLAVGGGACQSKGHLSPLPISYPSLVSGSPFNFSPNLPRSPLCHGQYCGTYPGETGSCQNIAHKRRTEKPIATRNKRLRKWWCGMKKRYVGDQFEKNEELFNRDENVDVAMEKRLANFLRSIKLSEYHSLFTAQEVDFGTFLTLTVEDLEEIGVKNPAHRSKIAENIRKFSTHASNF